MGANDNDDCVCADLLFWQKVDFVTDLKRPSFPPFRPLFSQIYRASFAYPSLVSKSQWLSIDNVSRSQPLDVFQRTYTPRTKCFGARSVPPSPKFPGCQSRLLTGSHAVSPEGDSSSVVTHTRYLPCLESR